MDVFISWSGNRSKSLAEALRKWLKQVINAVDPWLSLADIEKGARWRDCVASRLKTSDMGIICVTPGNLKSEWLLFEAGALSKAMDTAHVCPLLIGLEPSDVSGPLAQFQTTRATKDEIRALVRTINSGLGEARRADADLDEAFEVWWPKLEEQLKLLPTEEGPPEPKRSDRQILEEVLELVRDQSRISAMGTSSDFATSLEYRIQKELLRVGGVDGVLVNRSLDGASLLVAVKFTDNVNLPSTSFTVPIALDKTILSAITQIKECIREANLDRKAGRSASGVDLFAGGDIANDDVPF